MTKISVNKVICETYQKEGLKATVSNGFAMVQQKVAVKGLKVLVDCTVLLQGQQVNIPAGSTVHIKEESLHTQQFATKVYESEAVGQPFIIVDFNLVEFITHEG